MLKNIKLFALALVLLTDACAYTPPEEFAQKATFRTKIYNVSLNKLYGCFLQNHPIPSASTYITANEAYWGLSDSLKITFKPDGAKTRVTYANMPCCGINAYVDMIDECGRGN